MFFCYINTLGTDKKVRSQNEISMYHSNKGKDTNNEKVEGFGFRGFGVSDLLEL